MRQYSDITACAFKCSAPMCGVSNKIAIKCLLGAVYANEVKAEIKADVSQKMNVFEEPIF